VGEETWADWYAALPRKLLTAGALIRDPSGRVLLVKPTYKATWEVPGGMVEADESPRSAAAREVLEELGLDGIVGRLLVQQWTPAGPGRGDQVQYLYDGGEIVDTSGITLPPEELSEARFFDDADIDPLLHPYVASRVRAGLQALETGTVIEAEAPTLQSP
jgi:8-oxo-dGTP diphosphatase